MKFLNGFLSLNLPLLIPIAYNVAHAIFSGTAPIVQTALVLSSPGIAAQSSSQDPSLHPHLSAYYLRNDGRLRPAFYMVLVSIISLLALTFGVPYCEKKRKIIEDILTTEAAIEAAFEIEIITPDCEKDVEEEQVEEDDEEGACPEGYVQVDSSDSSHHRMILSV